MKFVASRHRKVPNAGAELVNSSCGARPLWLLLAPEQYSINLETPLVPSHRYNPGYTYDSYLLNSYRYITTITKLLTSYMYLIDNFGMKSITRRILDLSYTKYLGTWYAS
jgi:hypothetical protein